MSCSVCDELPLKRVRSIDKHLRSGKRTLSAIASRYAVDIDELQRHKETCLDTDVVPVEDEELARSQQQLSVLIEQIQQAVAAGEHLRFDPEGGFDGRSLVNQMIAAMREHRETVVARNKLRTSDELYHDLMEVVVAPLIRAVVAICTNESQQLREEVFSLTKPVKDRHPKITKAVDSMLERIGDRMKTEAMADISEKVRAVVGKKPGRGSSRSAK